MLYLVYRNATLSTKGNDFYLDTNYNDSIEDLPYCYNQYSRRWFYRNGYHPRDLVALIEMDKQAVTGIHPLMKEKVLKHYRWSAIPFPRHKRADGVTAA